MVNQKSASAAALSRDLVLIFFSIIFAIILAESGVLSDLVNALSFRWLAAFVCGIFFISIFTVVPATVILINLFASGHLLPVALFAAAGSLLGDLFLFRFIKDRVAQNIYFLLEKSQGGKRLLAIFKTELFRWLTPFVGALIIASPLPDEIGISLMGLSKVKTSYFVPISFFLNLLGILIIGLIVKGIM